MLARLITTAVCLAVAIILSERTLDFLPVFTALASSVVDGRTLDNWITNNSANIYPTPFANVSWDVENRRIVSTMFDQGHYQSRGSIANGYIGINLASAGPFFELDTPVNGDVINGWPLFSRRQTFAGVAGFWDSQDRTEGYNFNWLFNEGGESVISGIPHWSSLILDLGDRNYLDATVDNSTISKYETIYDYKAGTLSWTYTWSPKGYDGTFDVSYLIFANKLNINQAVVRMTVQPSAAGNVTLVNLLEGFSAVRTNFIESGEDNGAIYTAVQPWGIDNVTAYVHALVELDEGVDVINTTTVITQPYIQANESTIAQYIRINLKAGQNITATKYVGIASTDAFSYPKQTAKEAALQAQKRGFDATLNDHVSEWASIFPDDSVDDFRLDDGSLPDDPYLIESSVMAVVSPYYLLQNTIGPNALALIDSPSVDDYSISVGGLSSDSYAGLVFWDADVWMQPGLVAAFPESARRITNYRVAKYPQAIANVKTAKTSSKANTSFSDDAALYSWTSARFGNCTATGPCFDYEYHLNGDIGLALVNQWLASGDNASFAEKYFPVYNSIATAFGDLVQKNNSQWSLTNMTDPDEYANNVDAGGFTMPLISQTLTYANRFRSHLGLAQNETWKDIAANVEIIRDNDVTLEYSTMNNSVAVKQADVVLNTYPLDYTRNYGSSDALSDLDYYASKQSNAGPGMTYAIFSIVANEVSVSGCSSYTYQRYSYSPYIRGPFYQFSEQLEDDFTTNGGTHPAFPFLTGHGGANQAVLFGYLGLRYVLGDSIYVNPNLPPQVPFVRYRTFYWHGWPISAESNYTHTTIARATKSAVLSTADPQYKEGSIQVQVGSVPNKTYSLAPDGSPITIRNRQIGSVNTVAGNLAQCQAVTSPDEYQPGQFPISINDGAASTKWQPIWANNQSSVTIKLPTSSQGKSVSGFSFNWAQAPPANVTVIFHSTSTTDLVPSGSYGNATLSTSIPVTVSDPWSLQAATDLVITVQNGNTTNFTYPSPVPAPKYATLYIYGNQGLDQTDLKYENGTGATVAEWTIISA